MLTSTSRVLERDFAMQRDLERVLLGLPNLGHECQSHMFTEDVNLCEAYAGRLEDVISFIRVISRTFPAVSEHVTAAESILTNYLSHFQDRIHFLEGPFTISGRFRCPRLLDGSVERPRFEIPERIIIKTGRVVKCTSGMLPRSCDFWYHVIYFFQTREARFLFDDEFVNNIINYV